MLIGGAMIAGEDDVREFGVVYVRLVFTTISPIIRNNHITMVFFHFSYLFLYFCTIISSLIFRGQKQKYVDSASLQPKVPHYYIRPKSVSGRPAGRAQCHAFVSRSIG